MKRRRIPKVDNLTDVERKALVEAGKKVAKDFFEQKFGKQRK